MAFRTLSRDECLHLLREVPVGRVGVTIGALPAIFPVNFRMRDEDVILFGAMANSRLALSTHDAIVAFQVDAFDAATKKGWTVLGVGRSTRLEDDEARTAEVGGLPEPWTVGEAAEHLMQLKLRDVSGHEII